jgi:hypothetical protein
MTIVINRQSQSRQPANPGPLTKPSQPDRHSRDGGNPVSFNGAWIPGLRCASPGMTVLVNRQTNPASQPTTLPPASPNATDWTDHAPDGPRCPERRSLSVAPKRTSPQGPQRCRMAGTQIPPSMTGLSACPTHHRPADNRSCQPLPASHPGNPASRPRADPIRAQFGPADSRHFHASLTGLDQTRPASPRLSLPRSDALAPRTHFSRHDKHPFFANFA